MNDPPDPPQQGPPAGWYADPEQAQTQRYWDGEAWTDQRAPASQSRLNVLPLVIVGVGAAIAIVGTFLPRVEAETFARIAENSLIQSWDGLLVIAAALAGFAAAYLGREQLRRNWPVIIAALVIVGLAVYAGTGDRLHLTGTYEGDDYLQALDAIAGEDGSPGIGIWAVGIGGVIMAVGGWVANLRS